jgi:hypothetical protein
MVFCGPDRLRGERPLVLALQALDDLALARGDVERDLHLLLQLGHAGHEAGAPVQQPQDLVVRAIDLHADRAQRLRVLFVPAIRRGHPRNLASLRSVLKARGRSRTPAAVRRGRTG